ncbi:MULTISPECIES: acyl-CoA reductase [Lysinibacillus]|uniref:acyl-CoA reductase n=1 Tax=Lysinibacillus TaxID=400634 RepID=UPI000824F9DE|nr:MULTISPECIES: acyl-CoA reductase [Lysinibacillus]MEC1305736.1 acyl-CoA reductase [Lysinibacillus capsici]OCX65239.1 acyl-CoA reductase [Lysinibacillus sp. AR18-8]
MKMFWPPHKQFTRALSELVEVPTNVPFCEQVFLFTQVLSKRFVRIRKQPEIVALGYWLRKANIKQMKVDFDTKRGDSIVLARGTVFHIAPSNVDTIFVYSWMLSMLAGNRNIIRISSKDQNGLNTLLQIILDELTKPEFEAIANQTIICTYGHEEKATEQISSVCHTRVIWGGDLTVKEIRQVPLAPLANELTFPDRFSLSAMNSEAIVSLNESALVALANQFYNDVFWFDQMACSSPRLIIWTGNQQDEAKACFWSAFETVIQSKQYELLAATQVLKYTTALQLAAEEQVKYIKNDIYYSRVQLQQIEANVREVHCGGGLFYEYDVTKLIEASPIIHDKDQTLAYFGIEQQELQTFIKAISSRGLDRIVPIGQALDFDGTWDGQSFLTSFTRKVVMK